MTYPVEMRIHIISTQKKEALTLKQTALRFNIAMRTLQRWHKKLEPQLTRNKPFHKIDIEALKIDIEQHPDDYQYERAKRFGVSQNAIHNALVRLNITRKKNTATPQSGRRKKKTILPSD